MNTILLIFILLIIIGIIVFVYIQTNGPSKNRPHTYVCPKCDEKDCICHLEGEGE